MKLFECLISHCVTPCLSVFVRYRSATCYAMPCWTASRRTGICLPRKKIQSLYWGYLDICALGDPSINLRQGMSMHESRKNLISLWVKNSLWLFSWRVSISYCFLFTILMLLFLETASPSWILCTSLLALSGSRLFRCSVDDHLSKLYSFYISKQPVSSGPHHTN